MIKFLKSLGRTLTIALLTCVVFLLSCQSKMIYFPRPYDTAQVQALEFEGGRKVEYTTSQGKQTAFYLPPKGSTDTKQPPPFVWFVFGGNGSLSLDYSDEAPFWDRKQGYVFVDYPGYGLCEGKPNPKRIQENAVAVAEKVRTDFGWTEEELRARSGVFGHSIGCAAALIMADNVQLHRAVLCAPFTSLTDMGRHVLGWPLCYINMHRFDNVARLEAITARGDAEVRIFHGAQDEVIPVSMARVLRDRFPKEVRYTEMSKSHHNDVVTDARAEIGQAIRELSTPD
jgi:pimeloyl-ACP methyl ester carboxylesterase